MEYISVKVSSVFSQIDLVAFGATMERVTERLRTLYRQAMAHHYAHPDGRVTPKFINLDMEEYADLDLTVAAFREVLDEPEFLTLSAGIVLQAYLPDACAIQRELTAWAMARCARGGAPIKLRIVKGANLAMERIEAAVHGWPQAPYATKLEVDANFKRMVEYGCRPEHARAVHLGVASHNLFDIAYGLLLRHQHGVEAAVEFEMLEGMANHQARAVQHAPAACCSMRRWSGPRTSTAPSPIWCAGWTRTPRPRTSCATSSAWSRTAPDGIASAIASWPPARYNDEVSDRPAAPRIAARSSQRLITARPFENEPDTDWSLPANPRLDQGGDRALAGAVTGAHPAADRRRVHPGPQHGRGLDPSRPRQVAYRYALGRPRRTSTGRWTVARAAQPAWGARSRSPRAAPCCSRRARPSSPAAAAI